MINKKLEQLVLDLNENGDIFDENPLIYSSTGFSNAIDFNNDQVYSHEGYVDWKEFLEELKRLKDLYWDLHYIMNNFFHNMTNEEIEEKYGIGVEEG